MWLLASLSLLVKGSFSLFSPLIFTFFCLLRSLRWRDIDLIISNCLLTSPLIIFIESMFPLFFILYFFLLLFMRGYLWFLASLARFLYLGVLDLLILRVSLLEY